MKEDRPHKEGHPLTAPTIGQIHQHRESQVNPDGDDPFHAAPEIGGRRGRHHLGDGLEGSFIQGAHVLFQGPGVDPAGNQQVADIGQAHHHHGLHAAVARAIHEGPGSLARGRAEEPEGHQTAHLFKKARHHPTIEGVENQVSADGLTQRTAQHQGMNPLFQHQDKEEEHRRPQEKIPPPAALAAEEDRQPQGQQKADRH